MSSCHTLWLGVPPHPDHCEADWRLSVGRRIGAIRVELLVPLRLLPLDIGHTMAIALLDTGGRDRQTMTVGGQRSVLVREHLRRHDNASRSFWSRWRDLRKRVSGKVQAIHGRLQALSESAYSPARPRPIQDPEASDLAGPTTETKVSGRGTTRRCYDVFPHVLLIETWVLDCLPENHPGWSGLITEPDRRDGIFAVAIVLCSICFCRGGTLMRDHLLSFNRCRASFRNPITYCPSMFDGCCLDPNLSFIDDAMNQTTSSLVGSFLQYFGRNSSRNSAASDLPDHRLRRILCWGLLESGTP